MARTLLHLSESDTRYGGGQFIAKLYTEALGRMPDAQGYKFYQDYIFEHRCTAETLLSLAKLFFFSAEYEALGLTAAQKSVTAYRALLNRDPIYREMETTAARIESGELEDVLTEFCSGAEFAALLPGINKGPYFFGTIQYGWAMSGNIYSGETVQRMLDEAEHEVVLEPGDVVLVSKPLFVPAGKKLSTRGGYGAHYLRMARFVRTSHFDRAVITMLDGARCEGVWVDGNKLAYIGLRSETVRMQRAVDIGAEGDGSFIYGNRLNDALGGTSLEVYRVHDTTIRDNLITVYASDHYGRWTDGVTVHGTGTIIEDNGIIDATDVSIVLFKFGDSAAYPAQNSVARRNVMINVGNSAFGGVNFDGWVHRTSPAYDCDFHGCEITDNVFWTSWRAHQHICLSAATFAWMTDWGNFCVGAKLCDNRTPEGLFVLTGAGLAVDGQKEFLASGNKLDLWLGPWTNPEIGLTQPQVVCIAAADTGKVQGPAADVPMHVGYSGFIHGPWHEPFTEAVLEYAQVRDTGVYIERPVQEA